MSTSPPGTFLDRPPVLYVWRPVYRGILVPFVLPFMGALRAYFSAPLEQRSRDMEHEIAALRLEIQQTRLVLEALSAAIPGIHQKIDATYLDSLGQWSAMEHVVVSSLRLAERGAVKRYDLLVEVAREQRESALRNAENWSHLESLVMSLIAQPSARVASGSGSNG